MNQYYIIRNEQQAGPYTLEELASMAITPDTIVWTEGMADLAPAREVSQLQSLFAPTAQTPPHYSAPTYGMPTAPHYSSAPQYGSAPQYHSSAPQYNSATPQGAPEQRPPMPPNYLAWSIAVTLLCCLVGGIVAIVYSTQVSSRFQQGDYEGANASSRNARKWAIISAVAGAVIGIIYAIIIAVTGASAFALNQY